MSTKLSKADALRIFSESLGSLQDSEQVRSGIVEKLNKKLLNIPKQVSFYRGLVTALEHAYQTIETGKNLIKDRDLRYMTAELLIMCDTAIKEKNNSVIAEELTRAKKSLEKYQSLFELNKDRIAALEK